MFENPDLKAYRELLQLAGCPIFALPAEIRLQIYRELLCTSEKIHG